MAPMPNVHIRDVPPASLDALREAAERHGRSLNAELVAILVVEANRQAGYADSVVTLEEIRRRWRARNPDGFPPGLEPETLVREGRDRR